MLTNQMEDEIVSVIRAVDDNGGMAAAVQSGFVQRLIGRSALEFQKKVENKEQQIVGVNSYEYDEDSRTLPAGTQRPDRVKVDAYLERLRAFRANCNQSKVAQALDELGASFELSNENTFAKIVGAIDAGATHGEVCARVREAVGFGEPLVLV